jgi:hypothetical protein
MKQLTSIALVLLIIAACTPQTETKEADEVGKKNVELVKKLIAAYENEDSEALKEIYSVELESVGPQHGESWPYDSIIIGNENWFEASDSITWSVDYILPLTVTDNEELAGDWVLLWCDISWYDVKSGKSLIVDLHSPFRIENGKVVYEHSYWNQWDAFKQMGAKIKWPEEEKE